MNLSTKAVILAVLKYNDNDAIVKSYTEQTGFTSFFVRNLYRKKRQNKILALLQPNALLQLEISYKNKGQLERIKEAELLHHYTSIHLDFDKLNISTFIREILLESLKNEQADVNLFQFIFSIFLSLDTQTISPDFHLYFMLELTKYLGFYPDISSEGDFFDLQNGYFTQQLPLGLHFKKEESLLFKKLLGMIFATKNTGKITPNERKKLIDMLLLYYQAHIEQFKKPKSIKILHQIYE